MLERHVSVLLCPSCGRPLAYREGERRRREGALRCTACSERVPIVDGIPRFPVAADLASTSTAFDRLSPVYETPLWFPLAYRLIGGPSAPADDRAAIAALLDASGCNVLDVACGTGRFTRYVAAEAEIVWGIDVSEGMLRRARRYADRDGIENAAFARMDAARLLFDSEWFDRVACCWALHLFSDTPTALAEMRRVLKPGGRLAGATLSDDYVLTLPGLREGLRRTVGARTFDGEELRELLLEAGFTAVETDRRGAALFFGARR